MGEFFYIVTGPRDQGYRNAWFRDRDKALDEQSRRIEYTNRVKYRLVRGPEVPRPITQEDRAEIMARIHLIQRPVPKVPKIHGYPAEVAEIIQRSIQERLTEEVESGWFSCAWSDSIVTRGKQRFAVFGSIAFRILPFDKVEEDGNVFQYTPVIIGGRMFHATSEEGSGGLLYLVRRLKRKGKEEISAWWTTYLQSGRLRTSELGLSDDIVKYTSCNTWGG